MKQPCAYLLASQRNGTLYVGVTADILRRNWEHREGKTVGFTQKYGVTMLVWYEFHETMAKAIHREKRLKKYTRAAKLKLIEAANPAWKDLWWEISGAGGDCAAGSP